MDGAAVSVGSFALFVGGDALVTYTQAGVAPPAGTATSAVEGDFLIGGDEVYDFASGSFASS